jgi:hypothetical protein
MMTKIAVIALLIVASSMFVVLTAPMEAFADESETNIEQELKQSNVGSGETINGNLAVNLIDS